MDSFSGYRKWFKTDPEVYLGSRIRGSEGQKGSSSNSLRGAVSVSERGRESGRDMASQREKDTERSSGLSPGRHREYMVMKGMVDDIYDGRNNGMYEQYRHRQDNNGMYEQYRQDTHDGRNDGTYERYRHRQDTHEGYHEYKDDTGYDLYTMSNDDRDGDSAVTRSGVHSNNSVQDLFALASAPTFYSSLPSASSSSSRSLPQHSSTPSTGSREQPRLNASRLYRSAPSHNEGSGGDSTTNFEQNYSGRYFETSSSSSAYGQVQGQPPHTYTDRTSSPSHPSSSTSTYRPSSAVTATAVTATDKTQGPVFPSTSSMVAEESLPMACKDQGRATSLSSPPSFSSALSSFSFDDGPGSAPVAAAVAVNKGTKDFTSVPIPTPSNPQPQSSEDEQLTAYLKWLQSQGQKKNKDQNQSQTLGQGQGQPSVSAGKNRSVDASTYT